MRARRPIPQSAFRNPQGIGVSAMMGATAVADVVRAMEEWAGKCLGAARAGDAAAVEDAVAGLVDWLGHDLVDAFLFMDVPTWERLSDLAEELFQALRGVQAALGGPAGGASLTSAEASIGRMLENARAIRDAGAPPQ